MQDNLEFLQFTKRYWDQYYPGGEYDAVARRKASGAPTSAPAAAPRAATSGPRRAMGGPVASAASRVGAPRPAGGTGQSAVLQQENFALKETVTGLERERDFYFSKLRDIEVLIQQALEANPEAENDETNLLKQIQTILYSTEEGFEIPAEGEAVEEETF